MKKFALMLTVVGLAAGAFAQQSVGIKSENMDLSAKPQQDFYQYACGGWMKLHPLTAEYSRLGSFDMVAEENNARLKELVLGLAETSHANGSVEQKLADLYSLSMDSVRRNREGVSPMAPMLKAIAEVRSRADLQRTLAQLYMDGLGNLFSVYVDADSKDARMNVVSTYQGGLTLGQKSYYVDADKATKAIRKAYVAHIQKMFSLFGYDKKTAKNAAQTVLRLETSLAQASFSNVELRDPERNYNPVPFDSLSMLYPGLDWKAYFESLGLQPQRVVVGQPTQLKEACRLLQQEDLEDLKALLVWQVITNSASYLSDEVYQENFNFFGKTLSGRQAPRPRWKQAVSLLNGTLGEALGQLYVAKYFPPEYKARMLQLVSNLQQALAERIRNLSWMSPETKQKAIEKLSAFYVKVGYPDRWRDYSDLEIRKSEPLMWNVMAANRFEMKFNFSQAGKPVDRDRWQMTPQTVNAYYNPTTNEICFPAGILQYPFFDMQADDAFNYGAIGVVIGHEMTHGFDDQGSQFDKDGNLNNWWTAEDKQKFQAKTRVLADYFNGIEVLPGLNANGDFTLGENLADHGGLQISFQAFQNATKDHPLPTVDGLTPEQRFFLAYAGVWANNIREAEIRKRVKSDPHSLGRWRVNGALPHIPAWYDAFGITPESPMYVEPEKRCTIW